MRRDFLPRLDRQAEADIAYRAVQIFIQRFGGGLRAVKRSGNGLRVGCFSHQAGMKIISRCAQFAQSQQ